MSFFNKIFGGDSKETPISKTPIEIIEENLGVRFPIRFKEFIENKLPKNKTVKIGLLDGPYKFLNSLISLEESNEYESAISISKRLDELQYKEDKGLVKIPFAKSTEGDGFKYLYFVCEPGGNASEKVFLRDLDSPVTGRIPLCSEIPFIIRKTGEINGEYIVTNQSINFSDACRWLEIPDFFNVWENSYGLTSRDEESESKLSCDLFLINYKMEDPKENFSKIEIQITLNISGKRFDVANAYEIDHSGLQYQFANNINYRIFYHKLVCIIGTLVAMKNDLKNNYGIEIVDFLNTLDLMSLTMPQFRQVEERES